MKTSTRILACCFLIIIFVFSIANIDLLSEALETNQQGNLEGIRDTVQKAYVSDNLWLKNDFLNLNGLYARVSGRRVHNDTVRLKNGMLGTNSFGSSDMKSKAIGIASFADWMTDQGIPFLYVQMPYKLDADSSLLPMGVKNDANDTVNELLYELTERKVNNLDLRKELSATQEKIEEFFYITDHHWTPVGAFQGFRLTMQKIQELFPEEDLLSSQALNLEEWTIHTKNNQFLGYHGKRVGKFFTGTDNLIWITPTFDTQMSIYIPKYRRFVRGSFNDVIIQKNYIEDKASLFELNHYCVYIGGDYPLVQHRNEMAAVDKKLLIIKDSFSLPYQSFLSTVFSEVDVIDPRYYKEHTLAEYVKATKPDLVMLAINPSVLGWNNYFNYPLTTQHTGEESIIYQADISFTATDNKYLYKTIDVDLKPGVCYRVSMDNIQLTEGKTEGLFLALYDANTKTFYDTEVLDLAYCQAIGEYSWGFCTPESKDAKVKLLVYSGLHGQTKGVAVTYDNLTLSELN